MQSFVDDLGLTDFAHIADVEGDVWGQYGVTSQPAFVFLNDDGTSETLISALGEERLNEMIETLIAS